MAGAPGDSNLGGVPIPPVFGAPPGYDGNVTVDELFGEDLFSMDSPMGGGASPSGRSNVGSASGSSAASVGDGRASAATGGEDDDESEDDEDDGGRRRSKRRRQPTAGADGADDEDDEDDDDDGRPKRTRGGAGGLSALESVQEAADAAVEAVGGPSRAGKPRKRASTHEERLQRSRERNRIHARKSRLRKKFFVDSLKASLDALELENAALRSFVKDTMGRTYEELVADPTAARAAAAASSSSSAAAPAPARRPLRIVAGEGDIPTTTLEADDHRLMAALQTAQHNFVVSDPNMPDNPIVFASQGFYDLTGYDPSEVVGKNCRFLQGPRTDPAAVSEIREGIRRGEEVSVCLINYRKDGSPFWNQFFVAPLCDVHGRVVNFVGVQCEVPEAQAKAAKVYAGGAERPGRRSRKSGGGVGAALLAAASASSAMAGPPSLSAAPASGSRGGGRLLPPLLPDDDAAPLP